MSGLSCAINLTHTFYYNRHYMKFVRENVHRLRRKRHIGGCKNGGLGVIQRLIQSVDEYKSTRKAISKYTNAWCMFLPTEDGVIELFLCNFPFILMCDTNLPRGNSQEPIKDLVLYNLFFNMIIKVSEDNIYR